MGRTSKVLENPAVKTLKWKNEKVNKRTKEVEQETGWYYWDKNANDGEGKNIKVDLPIKFWWLESAFSVTGYNEKKEKGVYSNEVLNLKEQVMTVKCGDEIIAEGLWRDIKDEVKANGGNFCTAVYALVETNEGFEIWRFLMTGASSSWIGFNNNVKNRTSAIVCHTTNFLEKGSVQYEEPVFKYVSSTDEELQRADEAYIKYVEPYFDYVFGKNKESVESDY